MSDKINLGFWNVWLLLRICLVQYNRQLNIGCIDNIKWIQILYNHSVWYNESARLSYLVLFVWVWVDYILHPSAVVFIANTTVPNTLIYYLNQQTNYSLCVVVQKGPKGAQQSSALRGNIGLSLAGKGFTSLWLNGFYFKNLLTYLSKPNFCKVSKLLIHHKQPP